MGFIDRELARIAAAMADEANEGQRGELYAAQQALKWATEPTGYAAPLDMVLQRTPEGPTSGTLAEPAGCLAEHRQP